MTTVNADFNGLNSHNQVVVSHRRLTSALEPGQKVKVVDVADIEDNVYDGVVDSVAEKFSIVNIIL